MTVKILTESLRRESMSQIIEGGIYRHYKGKLYRLIRIVRHSETLEELVMYETVFVDRKVFQDSSGGID